MLIEIKKVYTYEVIFSYDCDGNTIARTVTEAVKRGANLSRANLSGVDLSRADLSGAVLSGANLKCAYLNYANLNYANLSDAVLSGAVLSGANLSRADLSGADLIGAVLSGANMRFANLRGAIVSDKKKLIGSRPIVQIDPIGSCSDFRSDFLVVYFTDDGIRIDTGCHRQITRETFESRMNERHGDNVHAQEAQEYRAALQFIDALVLTRCGD